MSSSPCVGCAWRPSPALITWTCEATWFAIRWAAPLEECRTTNMSACIAQRLSTVSSKVSPLVEDDTVIFRLMTSADRRFAAISKVVRVRVEGSKNRLNTDLPRRSGTFFTSRSVTPMKDAAVSRMCTRISRGSPSIVSRCWSFPSPLSCGFRIGESQEKFAALVARQAQKFACGHRKRGADILCRDRQLPFAAVDQRRQLDFSGAPIVEQLVHRGAHGAPGVQNIVDHDDMPAVDVERDLRRLHRVVESGDVEIVARAASCHAHRRPSLAAGRLPAVRAAIRARAFRPPPCTGSHLPPRTSPGDWRVAFRYHPPRRRSNARRNRMQVRCGRRPLTGPRPPRSRVPCLLGQSGEVDAEQLHRRGQPFLRRRIENDPILGLDREPGVLLDFVLELSRRPARVAERDEELVRASALTHRFQNILGGGETHLAAHRKSGLPLAKRLV